MHTFFYRIIFIGLIGLAGSSTTFAARIISTNGIHHGGKHIDAVGAVFDVEGNKASVGSGTYIGNRQVLSAAHIFYSVLPKSVPQKSGPVTINITSKNVFWSNDEVLDFGSPPAAVYHASSVTVDASFINNFAGNIHDPDKDDVKCDIAILTLDKDPVNVTGVSLPDLKPGVPVEGLLVGYGRTSNPHHMKHAHAQVLHGLYEMGQWGILMSNLNEDMDKNPLQSDTAVETKLEMLMGKDILGHDDVRIVRATQGDSGGPLMVVNDNELIQVIGVMSANSQQFNAFASLVVNSPEGLMRNPALDAMIEAAKPKR